MKKLFFVLVLCAYGLSVAPLVGAASDAARDRKRIQRPTGPAVALAQEEESAGGELSSASSELSDDDSGSDSSSESKRPKRRRRAGDLNFALYRAAKSNNIPRMRYLIKAGAKVNALSKVTNPASSFESTTYMAPLHIAAYEGNLAAVEFLLANGATLDRCNYVKETALYFAAMNGQDKVVRLLLDKGAMVEAGTDLNTPLHEAVTRGHGKVVAQLLAAGAQEYGQAYLVMAAGNGDSDIVEVFLQSGADVNMVDGGWTALSLAASSGNIHIVKLLLKAGADVNLCHPLLMAAEKGNSAIVEHLLEAGADVNDVGESNKTPLELVLFKMGYPRYRMSENGKEISAKLYRCAQILIAYGATTEKPEYQERFNQIIRDPKTIELKRKVDLDKATNGQPVAKLLANRELYGFRKKRPVPIGFDGDLAPQEAQGVSSSSEPQTTLRDDDLPPVDVDSWLN